MALVPARLLLPVRAVEPPHSSALSSASVCSAAGAYPHFSSFFHPPNQRSSSFFVAASLLEAQNNRVYKQSRYTQLRGPHISFDDVENPYAEGRSSHPSRPALNGRARSAPRFGSVDGNGGRRSWEPTNYQPWKRHGVSEAEPKARYNRATSSQGSRSVASWTSHAGEEAGHNGQRMALDNNGYVRPGDIGSTPWQRQGNAYQRGPSRFNYQRQEPSDTFSPWESSRNQEKRGSSRFDSSKQGQPFDAFSPGENRRNQEKRGKFNTPWGSNAGLLDEFKQHSDRSILDIRQRSHSPNGVLSLQPPPQSSYTMQSHVREGRWYQEEVQTHQEEMADRVQKANLDSLGEQEDGSFSGSSPISRIMHRLRSVEDKIPPLRAREGMQSGSEPVDVLALPSAREYLSDRSLPKLSGEQSEIGVADNRFPWEREDVEDSTIAKARKLRPQSPAELAIPGPELRRLRILAVHLKQRVKIGKHGVTRDLVSSIHKRFGTCEVVKVKCEGPPAGNMKKTLETLEKQTGGLIIWKSGSAAVLYRGQNYCQPVSEIVDDLLAKKYQNLLSADGSQEASLHASLNNAANEVGLLEEGSMDSFDGMEDAIEQLNSDARLDDASENLVLDARPGFASNRAALKKRTATSAPEFETLEEYTMEMDELLKDLGPRFEDWTGPKPLPVDADLLPPKLPNYSPPYRLLPFGMRPSISNAKATHFRRLSRSLAPHFVIGRDRGLEGLATAMVKLWEKSEIAKIGVKRGVLNTSHELIVEDLKQLTGGFFLGRDKYSLTFHRGNDFLPLTISAALADRQTRAENLQVEEERGRADGSVNIMKGAVSSGSRPSWVHILDPEEQIRLKKEAARARRVEVIAHLGRKLKMALEKKQKAEREINKVEQLLKPVASSDDKEILTDEERFMLRKLGLKMKAFLLLGRRRVFSGVVQNMHLHWKHRELVKVVVKERDPAELEEIARMLEAESGGTLISVDPTSKGFAIVVFRGKNYTRPLELRPPNLLTKRLALRRSLEMQRREALSRNMQGLEEEIALLRAGLNKMKLLEHGNEPGLSNESDNAHDVLKVEDSEQSQVGSQTGIQALTEDSAAHESLAKQGLFEDDDISSMPKITRRKLTSMCELGPIFKAVRLSKTERHAFKNEVLKMGKAPHCLVEMHDCLSFVILVMAQAVFIMPKPTNPLWKEHTNVIEIVNTPGQVGSGCRKWSCKYYGFTLSSTITRVVMHLTGINCTNNCGKCKMAPPAVREALISEKFPAFATTDKGKVARQTQDRLQDALLGQLGDSSTQVEESSGLSNI
ncbi:hypothetical protein L7F22_014392 [Adiantum nelumboides]|nr:hypothetical protein [Adiantum nelumboides]